MTTTTTAAPSAARPGPTREQLIVLLFSDPASDNFEQDALSILRREGPMLERVQEVFDIVNAETSGLDLDGESERDDLKFLACGAKRCAILLLHAAFAAEESAKPKPRAKPKPSPQLSLITDAPKGKRGSR